MFDVNQLREDFPILSRKVNGQPLVYLDNAATSQTPKIVIDSIVDYYSNYNANIHRGVHTLSQDATDKYETTFHVEYSAALSKQKENKSVFQGINPHEWILDFIVKLCSKSGALSTYTPRQFTTNLPFLPITLEKENKITVSLIKDNHKITQINKQIKDENLAKRTVEQIQLNRLRKKTIKEEQKKAIEYKNKYDIKQTHSCANTTINHNKPNLLVDNEIII